MIEIRNIEITDFQLQPLLKTIEKFSNISKDIIIRFDPSLGYYGRYDFKPKKNEHKIRVSTTVFQFADPIAKLYEMLGTILHELKHAEQQEKLGTVVFESKGFSKNKRIKRVEASDFFSPREFEARIFEENNLSRAAEFYWKTCQRMS